jgi:transposase-like protein
MSLDGMDKRDIEVKTRLNAEEFVAFHALAKRLGLDQASAMRMWIKEAIERHSARASVHAIAPDRAQNGTSEG